MFESQADQASGLRRLFGPVRVDLAAVVSARMSPWGSFAAAGLSRAMAGLGCRIAPLGGDAERAPALGWAAGHPDGLGQDPMAAPVVCVLLDDARSTTCLPPAHEVVGVLVGQADPDDLPHLYAQARSLASRHDVRRFGLLLEPTADRARRQRCRRNLDQALSRFAGARLVDCGWGDDIAVGPGGIGVGSVAEIAVSTAATAAFRQMAIRLLDGASSGDLRLAAPAGIFRD